jgi:diaminopimelate decarboxylase
MSCASYHHNNELYIEQVNLNQLAERYGTPCYVYSKAAIETQWRAYTAAFATLPHRICYSVKANSNIGILQLFAHLGSGFDVVSAGELTRVLKAGGDAKKVIFSGVGKTREEMLQALHAGIDCFNIESTMELERLHTLAQTLKQKVQIAIRVNPDVDAKTHMHITTGLVENKFGIASTELQALALRLIDMPYVQLVGLACHIGSQITHLMPFLQALDKLLNLYQKLQSLGFNLKTIDIGGGLGIKYHTEEPPSIYEYAQAILEKLKPYHLELILEPGRSLVGNAGVLLTTIEYIKTTQHTHFLIVDAGMNDLLRPALYDAWQNILPCTQRQGKTITYNIVGPICESADYLGKQRNLCVQANDVLAVESCGAYGAVLNSNYNSRPRAAEILVDKDNTYLIRKRESLQQLYDLESCPF